MTTLTTPEQLEGLPVGAAFRDAFGALWERCDPDEFDATPWRSVKGESRFCGETFVRLHGLPAQTLHPRTISAGDVERLARSLWIDDAPGRPQAGHEWDSLSMFPPVYERYRSLARADLTALGFEVTE